MTESNENLIPIAKKLEEQEKRLARLEQRVFGEEAAPLPVSQERISEAAIPAPPPPAVPMAEGRDWEAMLGGNWLVKIGIAALVLGVGFFLKLAFDNDWIGERGRILLGMLGGFSLLALGEYWQKKYPLYAQILTGGGVVILYFTTYAAYAFYDLIPVYAAFGFMGLVTLVAGVLALRYGTPTIAVVGMLGGFFAPFLFVKTVDEATLILYALVLDIGILALSTIRNWRPLTLIGLFGSLSLFLYWHSRFYALEKLWLAEGFLTALFLIFAFATILWHFLWKKSSEPADLALMTLNAAIYFGMSYMLLWKTVYGEWMGFFALALAAFYALLASAAFRRAEKDFRLTLFLGGISLVFLTIAMPIHLDKHWITIAWAVEGAVLVWLGFLLRSYHLRWAGLLIFLLTAVRLLVFDTEVPRISEFTPLFNDRFLTFAISIGAFFIASYVYKTHKAYVKEEERRVSSVLLLLGCFLVLWILSAETISYFDAKIQALRQVNTVGDELFRKPHVFDSAAMRNFEHAKNFSLSAIWAAYSILLVVIGIFKRVRVLRIAGLALFWITIFKVFVVDVFGIGGIYRVASLVSLGAILLVTGYLYQRYRGRIKEFLTTQT